MRKYLSEFQTLESYLIYLKQNNLNILIPESGYNTILHQIINNSSTDYQYIHDIDILNLN